MTKEELYELKVGDLVMQTYSGTMDQAHLSGKPLPCFGVVVESRLYKQPGDYPNFHQLKINFHKFGECSYQVYLHNEPYYMEPILKNLQLIARASGGNDND